MNMCIGEKIRRLRQKKGVTQEKMAERLSVSFQAVSKWENGVTLPDVTLIPAIAEYFGVSTDELFGINPTERDRRVSEVCDAAARIRNDSPRRAEALLREALERWPGDPILLNNLLYTIRSPERDEEVLTLCRALVENSGGYDDVRFDAWRIMAQTYARMGRQALAKDALEHIPEIYFTKLELVAELIEGEEGDTAARRQRNLSADRLTRMLLRVSEGLRLRGEHEAAEANNRRVRALMDVIGNLPYPFDEGTIRDRYAL